LAAEVATIVGDVVHQAHERIEGGNTVALWFRQKEKRVVEVAMGLSREIPAGLRRSALGQPQ
jgi:hypothetical protein